MSLRPSVTVIGRRLRMARMRIGIPQDKLGIRIGLDEGTASARISRYETGTHAPPFGIVVKLAQALNVPTAYFFCDDDDLAAMIIAWDRLSAAERKQLKILMNID